jgi:hypothetical protein
MITFARKSLLAVVTRTAAQFSMLKQPEAINIRLPYNLKFLHPLAQGDISYFTNHLCVSEV